MRNMLHLNDPELSPSWAETIFRDWPAWGNSVHPGQAPDPASRGVEHGTRHSGYGFTWLSVASAQGSTSRAVVDSGQCKLAADVRVSRRKCLRPRLRGLPLMNMHAPPHPGEFIRATYLEPLQLSERALARSLDVSPSTLNRIMTGKSGLSPDMALRLSRALGRSPESWLALQGQFDLWTARRNATLQNVRPITESAPGVT